MGNRKPLLAFVALLALSTALILFAVLAVGSHGHLMFRPHMTEDWVFWGGIAVSLATCICCLIKLGRS
jgi:hypothetical protein